VRNEFTDTDAHEAAIVFWRAMMAEGRGPWEQQPEDLRGAIVYSMCLVLDAYDASKQTKVGVEYDGEGTIPTPGGGAVPKGLIERLELGQPLTREEQGRVRTAIAARVLAVAVASEDSARATTPRNRAALYKTALDAYEAVADLVAPEPIVASFRTALLPPYLARRLPGDFDRLPREQQILLLERVGR
jgi:hypothetical protein